jgi:hypothetical protein
MTQGDETTHDHDKRCQSRAIVPYVKPRNLKFENVKILSEADYPCTPREFSTSTFKFSVSVLDENVPLMCEFMEAKTLCTVAFLSKFWNATSQRDNFWANLCFRTFRLKPESFHPPPKPVKRLFAAQLKVKLI